MKLKSFFFIPFLIIAGLLFSFENTTKYQDGNDQFVVVLDAGHGGHDPGNLGNGYLEKNIALNIVLRVGSILKQNSDIKVIYTRDDDTFVDLYVRGEIANEANADLFVSVHCDSHSSDAHGAGTFVLGLHANEQNFEIAKKENSVIYLEDNYETRYADYDINSPESVIGLTIMQEEFLDQSIALAKNIQENFAKKLKRKDREVKQAGFIVLHQTFMPSVLVETGFLTNKAEGAYLNSNKGQSEIGAAIADAILRYRAGVRSNSGPLAASTTPEPIIDDSTIKTVGQIESKTGSNTTKKENQAENQAEKNRLAEEAKIAEAAERARKEKEAQAEKDRLAEEAKKLELAELAERRRKAKADKKAQEEQAEKDRMALEAQKAREAQAEKDRLAEEAKKQELADVEARRKEAEAAKKAQEEQAEKERIAKEAQAVREAQAEKDRLAEEAKKRELAEIEARRKKAEAIAQTETGSADDSTVTPKTENTDDTVVFKVQLLASGKQIPLDPQNFNGLNELSKEPIRNLFRYMYGNATSYEEAKQLKANADQKGYPTSYIVAYKSGKRITVKEARKYVKE